MSKKSRKTGFTPYGESALEFLLLLLLYGLRSFIDWQTEQGIVIANLLITNTIISVSFVELLINYFLFYTAAQCFAVWQHLAFVYKPQAV